MMEPGKSYDIEIAIPSDHTWDQLVSSARPWFGRRANRERAWVR